MSSCSNDNDAEKRIEFAKIVESRSSQDLLNDLYIGSDADVDAIARIMNVPPSSIERIRNGETAPTDQFEERIHEVSVFYMQNDQSFSKLQSVLDPEYGWYDTILNFPSHHPWWFWCGNALIIILAFISGFFGLLPLSAFLGFIEIGELLLGLIAWITSLICSPNAIQDSYVDSINPTIEQIE